MCGVFLGYGVSKVVSPVHSVAAPVYGGYGGYSGYGGYGGYAGYGAYGGYGVSKVVSPVAALGMCVTHFVLLEVEIKSNIVVKSNNHSVN